MPSRSGSPSPSPSPSPAPSPSRAPSRRADAERNRRRLLEAGRAAFAAGGEDVTLQEVARAAGVGIGTLYRHFPSREALLEAIYRFELEELCDSASELLAVHAPEAALRAWLGRFGDYVQAKRQIARALQPVYASGAVQIPQIRAQLAGAVAEILRRGVLAGSLRAEVRADDVVAMVVGIFATTAIAGGPEQRERLFELLMDAVRVPGPV